MHRLLIGRASSHNEQLVPIMKCLCVVAIDAATTLNGALEAAGFGSVVLAAVLDALSSPKLTRAAGFLSNSTSTF